MNNNRQDFLEAGLVLLAIGILLSLLFPGFISYTCAAVGALIMLTSRGMPKG